jgi:hypothetical protein
MLALAIAALPPNPKLAAPGFSSVNVEDRAANFFAEFFAQKLQEAGLSVISQEAIASLVGFERQKALLGCSDQSASCVAELAGALGVDGLVVGSLGKFGGEYAVTIKIISAGDARTVQAESGRLDGERALLDWLTSRARRMATALGAASAPRAAVELERSASGKPVGTGVWIFGGLGAGLGVLSAVSYGLARSEEARLRSADQSLDSSEKVQEARNSGEGHQTLAGLSAVLGGLSLGVAGILYLTRSPAPVALLPRPGGAAVVWAGSLP